MIGLGGLFFMLSGTALAEEDGKALYDKKCKLCHAIGDDRGAKADLGGKLDGVGSKRDEAWLRAYLTDPKSKIEGAKMPKMKLSDAEMDALVKYMLSLK
jgi:nitric oxide reductase subunit C